ncbi:MAG TPA: polyprenyl synthetase family protein [Propionibacteriaceae bacterium]|nr:polyprenyl synthetase family protein [Propionibacteriaceae bacterium]
MSSRFDPRDPASADFRAAVGSAITGFLDTKSHELDAIDPDLGILHALASVFTAGGKRLRPAFAYWGRVAAAGQPSEPEPLIAVAASLDLLHVSALVHDDLMDASDTRRGVPAVHRQLEDLHRERQGRGTPEAFGRAGAILLGDLLIMWSEEMLTRSGLEPAALAKGLPLVEAMRTEVTCGQWLDVIAQSAPSSVDFAHALATATKVVEFKTNRYTVQRPLQFGAALGGAGDEVLDALAAFASPLGRAFQFRDDVLGIFGDEELTGKPAGDDLREGKRTVLIAHALAGSSPTDAAELDALLGDHTLTVTDIERGRAIITTSGAREAMEHTIEEGYASALGALATAPITDEGRTALAALAEASVRRSF